MECLLIWKSSILGITTNIKFQGKTYISAFALWSFLGTSESHENWYSTNKNKFTVRYLGWQSIVYSIVQHNICLVWCL